MDDGAATPPSVGRGATEAEARDDLRERIRGRFEQAPELLEE